MMLHSVVLPNSHVLANRLMPSVSLLELNGPTQTSERNYSLKVVRETATLRS